MNDPILAALEALGFKRKGAEYLGCSPFRQDKNPSFSYNPVEMVGYDFGTATGYSKYELAERLGVELPSDTSRIPVGSTLQVYSTLADYALRQGVPVKVFQDAKWLEGEHYCGTQKKNRPCFSFPTATGTRYRFTDGLKPKYTSQSGYKPCWYGLKRAKDMQLGMLILCNGEASTIVAQHYGVPAFCQPGGERRISDELLMELSNYAGAIWIALDCDEAGRNATKAIKLQLPNAVVIDLGLSDGGDLANFCKLYETDNPLQALRRLAPVAKVDKPDIVYSHSVALHAVAAITEVQPGYGLPVPFKSLHKLGGFAQILDPGILVLIAAPTGGGKTSWIETWVDAWLRKGIGGVWRGDEFTAQGYHKRRIQRYGGITTRQIRLQEQWLREENSRIPYALRDGKPLTPEELEHYQKVSLVISEWWGKLGYYEGANAKRFIEPMLEKLTADILTRRATGEIVAFAVFDYIQLLRSSGVSKDETIHEYNLGLIKDWTIDMQIVSIVGAQMTKSASEIAKNNQTNEFGIKYLSSEKANLAIFPQLVYDERGNRTGQGIASVRKNSEGETDDIPVMPDFERLQWVEVQTYDTRENA